MSRSGITQDQVFQAADQLKGRGETPTIENIRAITGGSPNTVHRHKKVWEQSQPRVRREAPQLPVQLQSDLVAELERQAVVARAEAEAKALEAEENADTLAEVGEALEIEVEELRETVERLFGERDRAVAVAEEKKADVDRLMEQLRMERNSSESARTEVATARVKFETQLEQLVGMKAELAECQHNLEIARESLQKSQRLEAVAEVKSSGLVEKCEDLKSQLLLLRGQYDEIRKELFEVRAEWRVSQEKVEASNEKWREQLALEHKRNSELQSERDSLLDRIAILEAKK